MVSRATPILIALAALCGVSTPDPSPQYYPFPGQQTFNNPQDQTYSGSQTWTQTLQNFSNPLPSYLDPLSSPAAEELLKNDIPRQAYGIPQQAYGLPQQSYGAPPPPNSPYPQIYKLDNLIIIANPVQAQPQPCIPQRPPPQFPRPGGDGEGGLDNRFGEEPTKCTWAIVACCSPGSNQIRYNCFELLGCPGFFFDNSPCDPDTVMAAANAALEFYRSSNNGTSSKTNPNNL